MSGGVLPVSYFSPPHQKSCHHVTLLIVGDRQIHEMPLFLDTGKEAKLKCSVWQSGGRDVSLSYCTCNVVRASGSAGVSLSGGLMACNSHGTLPVSTVSAMITNIHEINTWKCPIQTQCGYIGYISQDNIHEINTWKCPIQTQCG